MTWVRGSIGGTLYVLLKKILKLGLRIIFVSFLSTKFSNLEQRSVARYTLGYALPYRLPQGYTLRYVLRLP